MGSRSVQAAIEATDESVPEQIRTGIGGVVEGFPVLAIPFVVASLIGCWWLFSRRSSVRDEVAYSLARAGSLPDPRVLTDRAQAFAAEMDDRGRPSTLFVRHSGGGLESFLTLPATGKSDAPAITLAQSVAARADRVPRLPDLAAGQAIVEMRVNEKDPYAGRDVQIGDPAEVGRAMARVMTPGAWAALVVRRPKTKETARLRTWYQHWLGASSGTGSAQHHAFSAAPLVASMYVGAPTIEEARSVVRQAVATMPGFDLNVVEDSPRLFPSTLLWSLLAIGLAVVAGWLGVFELWEIAAVMSIGTLPAAGVASALLPSRAVRLRRSVEVGQFPTPAFQRLWWSKPKRAQNPRQDGSGGRKAKPGSYPLARGVTLIGAPLASTFVAPHAGGASGASTTTGRDVPAIFRSPIGPRVGLGGTDATVPVFLSQRDRRISIFGVPEAGKSALVRELWAYDLLERRPERAGNQISGSVGNQHAMIALETKGPGADHYEKWATRLGVPVLRVDLANEQAPAIDMFPGNQPVHLKASLFVSAMVTAFGENAIQNRSFSALVAAIAGGLVTDENMATKAGARAGSPIWYALVLLGGSGDETASKLAAQISREADEAERRVLAPEGHIDTGPVTDYGHAAELLGAYYGSGVTARDRRNLFDAPRNKLEQLLEADAWFDPKRPKISWDQLIREQRVVIVNTGASSKDTGARPGERTTRTLASMLLHLMRHSIEENCTGWHQQGRAVSLYADEVADVAGQSAEVLSWMRERGREWGVRMTLATQRTDQLAPEIRSSMMNFDTVVWMRLNAAAEDAAADLSLSGEEWTAAEVANLPPYHGIVRSVIAGQRQPSCVIKVDWWEDSDPREYAAAQPMVAP